jgi:hypothetical protein
VIQITLTFKSIEAARAALLDIPTSALVGGPAPEKAEAPKKVKAKGDYVTTDGDILHADGTLTPAPAEVAVAPKPEPVATTSSAKPSASVDYPTLQKAVFALAGKSRESAGAVAASFGVKTFKELPEAKWSDALVAVNNALAEAA